MGSDLWGVIKEDHARHTEVLLSMAKELQNTQDRLSGILSKKKKIHRPFPVVNKEAYLTCFPCYYEAKICPKAKSCLSRGIFHGHK